jgi:dihydrolipoyl dehydrogenase
VVDFARVARRLQETVDAHAAALERTCHDVGVTIVSGAARFDSSRELSILDNATVPRVHFRRAVIATGSQPHLPAELRTDDPRITTPDGALPLPALPGRLLVVGGSSTAMEVASFYATLGTRVTVADAGQMFVPQADRDLVEHLLSALSPMFERLRTGTRLGALRPQREGIVAQFDGADAGDEETFDDVVLAVGRIANTDRLNLDATRVERDTGGFIMTDEQMRTADPRILAVGDVTGEPMLARKAAHQGRVAAEAVAGWSSVHDPRAIPMTVFTDPPVAWCGLTEATAAALGEPYAVHRVSWSCPGLAEIGGASGVSKILFEPDSKLVIGVGMIGRGAADLIAEAVLAIEMGAVLDDIADLVHPHPGASETLGAAARGALSAQ